MKTQLFQFLLSRLRCVHCGLSLGEHMQFHNIFSMRIWCIPFFFSERQNRNGLHGWKMHLRTHSADDYVHMCVHIATASNYI